MLNVKNVNTVTETEMAKVIIKEGKQHPVVLKLTLEEAGKVRSIVGRTYNVLTDLFNEMDAAGIDRTHEVTTGSIRITPITN